MSSKGAHRKRKVVEDDQRWCTVLSGGGHVEPFEIINNDDEEAEVARLDGDFLTRFVAPMAVQEFMDLHWEKRALLIKCKDSRLDLDQWFHSGDVSQLLDVTPSERVHVWLARTAQEQGNVVTGMVESFQADADQALSCHRAGASLYFRAPPVPSAALVSGALASLGPTFAARQPDGSVRGEVETFVSRTGHITEWHYDFMENFTFQLQGRKRWYLCGSSIPVPLRGVTPHYHMAPSVVEMQVMTARFCQQDFKFNVPDASVVQVVDLGPGDVFYFPSGMYHRVECTEDSLSINVSLEPANYGDYLQEAVTHLMRSTTEFRQHIVGHEESQIRAQMQQRLDSLKQLVNTMTVDMLLPPALLLATDEHDEVVDTVLVQPKQKVRRNPLAGIVERTDLFNVPIHGDDDGDDSDGGGANRLPPFVVHFNTGNEDFVPWIRREIHVDDEAQQRRMRALIEKSRSGAPFTAGSDADLCSTLVECGYLLLIIQ